MTRVLCVGLAVLLAACGGGTSDDDGGGAAAPQRNGVFVDDPVQGLNFRTPSVADGVTDAQGRFRYLDGETVSFFLGTIPLGSARGAAVLTPADLVTGGSRGTPVAQNPSAVTNLARLLQTLDADCDVTNGIQLTAAARNASGVLDFNQDSASFGVEDGPADTLVEAAAANCAGDNLLAANIAQVNLQRTHDYLNTHDGQANRLPEANAGADRTVTEGSAQTLVGSGSDPDGGAVSFQWRRISGPAVTLSNADTATVSFTAPAVSQQSLLTLRLTVTDTAGATAFDEVVITITDTGGNNTAPVANAGADQSVTEGDSVTLDGRASQDAEDGSNLSFAWSQTAGPTVILDNANTAQPDFTAPTVTGSTALTFRLTVGDTQQAEAQDEVTVTVNDRSPPPPPAFDLCEPAMNRYCLSDLPVLGPLLLDLLEPLLGTGDVPDPVQAANPLIAPLADACQDNSGPAALCAPFDRIDARRGPSRFVEPRIGSYPPGFTNPGPVLPFGMVAVGPDTEGPLNYGGYSVQNALITGFSHVHMSAGVFKAGQLPVLPFTGELTPPEPSVLDPGSYGYPGTLPPYASPFERATEVAEAGYYSTLLLRYGVLAELTATERVALHRYTYNDPAQAPRLLFDLSRMNAGYRPAAVSLHQDGTLTGRVQVSNAGGFDLHFAARLDRPFTAHVFAGETLAPGQTLTGDTLGLILDFDDATSPVLFKLALSYTDEAGALRNLEAELPGWDFDATRVAARETWDRALSRIVVEGGTEAEKISFYTALYRLYHFPNLHSDVDGRYRGPDRAIHESSRPHYSQFSSWDSYRGQNQLQAELFPDIYREMTRSLLDFAAQNGGILPRWQQGPGDAAHMSGDPIIPFIAEGWCRGQYDAALRAEIWPVVQALAGNRSPRVANEGYLSVPKPGSPVEQLEGGPREAGTTLEFGIADFALALMAQDAAPAQAAAIAQRSLNYRNLLDPETQWIRPRHDDGSWLTPFAPELGYGFQEGTSWQYSWLVTHDYAGLIERMGGDAVVDRRLDLFFNFPASQAPLLWPTLQSAVTVFGTQYYGNQYVPGNEHDLQAPYVYHYSGAPWKSQAVARAATSIFTPTSNGLPGNDDLGALSGWLLWSMMGLYPMNPGTPLYVVGSPHFDKVTLKRRTGDLVIEAPGASAFNRFVTAARVDGQPLERSWLLLPRGATTLRLDTSAVPDMTWGAAAAARPPSLSTATLGDFGCTAQ